MSHSKVSLFIVIISVLTIALFSCQQKQEQAEQPKAESTAQKEEPDALKKAQAFADTLKQDVVVIETDFGTIFFKFYEEEAPQHAANFKKLAREGFYDGCTFHRVVPGFVIQGGSPTSKDDNRANDGAGGPGYTIPAEIGVKHTRGSVAAARQGDQINPERRSSGSQFYICVVNLPRLDELGYSVYGQVIEGMDVADQIVRVQRDQNNNPLQKVEMKKVSIVSPK